jgi:hypothetical protein
MFAKREIAGYTLFILLKNRKRSNACKKHPETARIGS